MDAGTLDGGRSLNEERADGLAPVIPLFGGAVDDPRAVPDRAEATAGRRGSRPSRDPWHTTWTDEADDAADQPILDDDGASAAHELAEAGLLKKLRARSLSVREAREVLIGKSLERDAVEAIIDRCLRHGYLDDARLAEQLVYAGADRKGQGRQAIAQTLAKRGIPRDLADAALADTEDDDAERALDYARHKAQAFRDVDREAAVRRLVGQLSRRGYPGHVAMTAARTALDEIVVPRSGVRFES